MLASPSSNSHNTCSQRKAAESSKSRNAQTADEPNSMSMDFDFDDTLQNTDSMPKSKRPKRPKKSVNENLEPVFTPTVVPEQSQYPSSLPETSSGGTKAQAGEDGSTHNNSFT